MQDNHVKKIKEIRETIATLQKILIKIDPASGITVHIKLGAMYDTHLPLASFETCDHMKEILELAIDAQRNSLKLWERSATLYRKEIDEALASN